MGLDISLYTDDPELPAMDMNWLRNPFGLRDWAEDNYRIGTGVIAHGGVTEGPEHDPGLWHVINNWSHDRGGQVDRPLFKRVVDEYWSIIDNLEVGYFVFNLGGYLQFVEEHSSQLPREYIIPQHRIGRHITGSLTLGRGDRLAIPQDHFAHRAFNLGDPSLARYKAWFAELVRFAELLQDDRYHFYCSN